MSKIRVGVTGSGGFIGSHVVERLGRDEGVVQVPFERSYFEDAVSLREFVSECDAIIHLAGVNRGTDDEIYVANVGAVRALISCMEEAGARPHVIFASSTQQEMDNPYGRSKRDGARMLKEWAAGQGAPLSVLVIPNVYGDGCRPFYNSVVATFCHQLTHGETPTIINDREVEFIYINELTEYIHDVVGNPPGGVKESEVAATASLSVSELLSVIKGFRDDYFSGGVMPVPSEQFHANLFRVFLSYVDSAGLGHSPEVHSDPRGELYEVLKLSPGGQIFFSSTRPGVVRGNHYHTRKMERFCVLKGEAVIRLRRVYTDEVVEYRVQGGSPRFIDIPSFHTHNIENTGEDELLTLFWCNEIFDPSDPDTYYQEV